MVITVGISFATGTSWGTYAVVLPIAMPLAYAVNPDPTFITLCFAASVGGATAGDQCSPISDTTILSSLATGSDLMDHVYTQLPIAAAIVALSTALYLALTAITI